jgi:hypothetical protein
MRIARLIRRSLLAYALLSGLFAAASRAEIFVLHDGGRVRGELVNRDEAPRKTYLIKTATGGQVTLEAAQVKEVKRQGAAEMQYDRIQANYSDTVEDQWKLAEWCRENRLYTQRKVHLERIIASDPNHAAARHALGYGQIHGRWVTRETLMTENGYVRYKGQWMLPQELEILEQQRKEKLAQSEWADKLKRWHAWLRTDKAEQAEVNIKAIDDPFAAKALAKYFDTEQHRAIRMLYLDALARLKPAAGMETLVDASLHDGDEEIRIACLDQVASHDYKPAVRRYVQALKSKDNATINRAAICLARMKDTSAIAPLIDALVTTHSFTIQKGNPGGTSASFAKGPGGGMGGLSVGGSVETVHQRAENGAVLQALVELTGGVSFNFDTRAWQYWYAAQKKPQSLDSRRDDVAK